MNRSIANNRIVFTNSGLHHFTDRLQSEPTPSPMPKKTLQKRTSSSDRYSPSLLSALHTPNPEKSKRCIVSSLSYGMNDSIYNKGFVVDRVNEVTTKIIQSNFPLQRGQIEYFQSKLSRIVGKHRNYQQKYFELQEKIKRLIERKKAEEERKMPTIQLAKVELKETLYDKRRKNRVEEMYNQKYKAYQKHIGKLHHGRQNFNQNKRNKFQKQLLTLVKGYNY